MSEELKTIGKPQPFEDRMRTTGEPGTYEWWYFDAEFEDETKVTIVYMTKDFMNTNGPSQPRVRFDLAMPGQAQESFFVEDAAGNPLQASREKCDVTIKGCHVEYGDDGFYHAHFQSDDEKLKFDLTLKPLIPMWRPGDGFFRFGEGENEEFFAWFVAVPSGIAEGVLTVNGETKTLKGTGYHDHNWGNAPMQNVFDHWYWARAAVDGYTVINSDLIASAKYGYGRRTVFLVAKDGEVLSDAPETKVVRGGTYTHEVTDKFMDNQIIFTQKNENTEYSVEYDRERDIIANHRLYGEKRAAAQKMGLDPSYVRCVGKVKLTVKEGGKEEVHTNSALWEQMGFGNAVEAIINE